MKWNNMILLVIGITFILLSLYIFTRPAYFESWDFSNTGQIGDTIGGITAPIINLLGALLVYISFQEQVKANKIQMTALENEKNNNSYERKFNNYTRLYESIKNHLDSLEFIVQPKSSSNPDGSINTPNHIIYKGLNALNEYVLRIENPKHYIENYETNGMFLNFQYLIKSLLELGEIIELNINDTNDKKFLEQNIKLMYKIFLRNFAERIIRSFKDDDPIIIEFKIQKKKLEEKYEI